MKARSSHLVARLSVFTKRHSSTFVKDGFINRGGAKIAGRDWVCWLIPACLLPHADIHLPDATCMINYLQTCLLDSDKCVLLIERCVKAACRRRFVAPFAFINGGKPHKLMSRGACPTLLVILVSPGLMSQEERASSVKVRERDFMVVESAAGNEKAPVVKGNMHKLHKVMSTR